MPSSISVLRFLGGAAVAFSRPAPGIAAPKGFGGKPSAESPMPAFLGLSIKLDDGVGVSTRLTLTLELSKAAAIFLIGN